MDTHKIVPERIQNIINEIQRKKVNLVIQNEETIKLTKDANIVKSIRHTKGLLNKDSNISNNLNNNYINGVCAEYSAYSSYFNKNIANKTPNFNENTDEYSYKPIVFYYDDYLIEFRINSVIKITAYNIETGEITKILFDDEVLPASMFLLVEENYEQKLKKLLFEEFSDLEDENVQLCCVIPQEYNIARALKNEIVINRLKNIDIDVNLINFSNTIIFIDGLPVKCYQEKFYETPITDILLKENLQILLAENSEKSHKVQSEDINKESNEIEAINQEINNIYNQNQEAQKKDINDLLKKTMDANKDNDYGVENADYLNSINTFEENNKIEDNNIIPNEIDKEVN